MWICSRAVSSSKNAEACSWTPIRGSSSLLRGQGDVPSSVTPPLSAALSPSMISSVVVLPAPLGPEDPEELARTHLEAHTVDGTQIAIALAHVIHDDDGCG